MNRPALSIDTPQFLFRLQKEKNSLEHLLMIIIVFSLILGAMTTVFLFNCIRKLMRDQKIIRVSEWSYSDRFIFHINYDACGISIALHAIQWKYKFAQSTAASLLEWHSENLLEFLKLFQIIDLKFEERFIHTQTRIFSKNTPFTSFRVGNCCWARFATQQSDLNLNVAKSKEILAKHIKLTGEPEGLRCSCRTSSDKQFKFQQAAFIN